MLHVPCVLYSCSQNCSLSPGHWQSCHTVQSSRFKAPCHSSGVVVAWRCPVVLHNEKLVLHKPSSQQENVSLHLCAPLYEGHQVRSCGTRPLMSLSSKPGTPGQFSCKHTRKDVTGNGQQVLQACPLVGKNGVSVSGRHPTSWRLLVISSDTCVSKLVELPLLRSRPCLSICSSLQFG